MNTYILNLNDSVLLNELVSWIMCASPWHSKGAKKRVAALDRAILTYREWAA